MILALFLFTAPPAIAQVDSVKADGYFKEAKELCERENGRLWGVSLYGPMVIADAVSGTIATNQPVPDEPRPRVLGYANVALEWGDERWATFVWQMVPQDQHARGRMMIHELFHRVQPKLSLFIASREGTPDHLNTPEGRYWMQLEWRALTGALESSGPERIEAVSNALTFRLHRRSLFVDGPVLILPHGRNASFITTGITPIPGEGTIYPNFRVSGEWGSITAKQVLLSPDGNTLTVPAPTSVDGDTLAGEAWTVFLKSGWL